MKQLKPIQVLLIASLGLLVWLIVLLSLYSKNVSHISFSYILMLAFGGTLFSFLIGRILLKIFIEDKIRNIHRIINFGSKPKINLNEDMIGLTMEETTKWENERKKEITALRKEAVFRREFLGNLAHELKTPVFSIQGYILTLLEGGLEDEKVNRKFLERAAFSTERMVEIIEDLDQIMKLESDEIKLKLQVFDMLKLAKEIVVFLEEKSHEKSISIKIEKKEGPVYVKADRAKIGRVLTNLISNAINYSNENTEINIQFYPLGESMVTEISDNGIGIAERDIPRLFERFYRVEQSRNRNAGGSGLGLSICKHIIESHNETITVKSKLGQGSTFSFSLSKSQKPSEL